MKDSISIEEIKERKNTPHKEGQMEEFIRNIRDKKNRNDYLEDIKRD